MSAPYSPLGTKVLLRLLPERRKAGRFFLPDRDSIKFCSRCDKMMEALADSRCTGEPEFALNRRDSYDYRGMDYSHDIQYVTSDIVAEQARRAEVLAVGRKVKSVAPGQRVVVRFDSGEGDEHLRLVEEAVILAEVEE